MIKIQRLLLILTAGLIISACSKPDIEPPNILWLTSEDNNVDWVGCYGNKYADTPNLDALAEDGFRYTHCYANAPVCAPSRSTWITGMHAISTGTHPMRSRYEIPHDLIKYYPDLLKDAGYYVSNGSKTDYNIGGRPDRECWDQMDKKMKEPYDINWNELATKQPFFKVINFPESHESRAQGDVENTIHDPANVNLHAFHPDLPDVRKNYAKYHDAVKRMDTDVGFALEKLEEAGLSENTIIVYCSDHGGVLPRSKRYLFATGIHTPLIVRIPAKYKSLYPAKKPGSTVDRMVSFIDMPKTWLSLCGITPPENMQGTIFLGNDMETEQEYHFAFRGRMDERNENARAVYDKNFVYIRNYMPYAPWMQNLEYLWKMKATVAWDDYVKSGKAPDIQSKYFFPKTYTEEFYNLNDDWDNTNNLIDDEKYAGKIESMRKALRSWQLEIHDTGLIPESEMAKMSEEHQTTIFELARNPELYNLPALLDAADMALAQDAANLNSLREMLKSSDIGIRYWAIVGCFLLNDEIGALHAINDASHEVRAMAAWILIKSGKKEQGLATLQEMIENESYALLKIQNIMDWMGDDGKSLNQYIQKLQLAEDRNYEIRMKNKLASKWSD